MNPAIRVYGYDLQGRLVSKRQTTKVGTVSFTHTWSAVYNAQGQLSAQTYPSGLQIDYGYDSRGQIDSVGVNGQILLNNLTYQPFGPPESWTWGNGRPHTRHFDADGRLVDYPLGADSRVVTYDAASRITAFRHADAANDQDFDYDPADRLSLFSDSTGSQAYQYDANGNRASLSVDGTTYSYALDPASNRLLSVQGPIAKTYRYDAAGNLTSNGKTALTWNAAGRASPKRGMAPRAPRTNTMAWASASAKAHRLWPTALTDSSTTRLDT